MKPIRLLLVDDHPLVRAGIKAELGKGAGFEVVGEAGEGETGLLMAAQLRPDIVLLDIRMPGLDGIAAAKELQRKLPRCRVVIFSMNPEGGSVLQAIAAGVKGYVQKDASAEELRRALFSVHRGGKHFSEAACQALLAEVVDAGSRLESAGTLTPRESEVLAAIAEGASNKEVAAALKIGVRTAETHRHRLMSKLGIHTVAGLTKYALARGLITLT